MSKEYTTTVRYNVKFVDLPSDKLLLDEREVSLHLQVVAPGFTILAQRISFKKNFQYLFLHLYQREKATIGITFF